MNKPIIVQPGTIQKPIMRNSIGFRQCTKCGDYKPECRYPSEPSSLLGRARICASCQRRSGTPDAPLVDTSEAVPLQEAATSPIGLSQPLYADPDPNPPPRLVLLGPWAGPESRCMVRAAPPTRLPRPPIAQRPMPVVRAQRRYAANGMAIVDYDGVAWGTCSNHQHMRPLAEFYGPDRYGTMSLFRICAPCREQLRLRKREQRAQAKQEHA
jgi:hypothetical protein